MANELREYAGVREIDDGFREGKEQLDFTLRPEQVFAEAARVLRPGGRLLLTTLASHRHAGTVAPYGHSNLGHSAEQLQRWCQECGLKARFCGVSSQERRPPHFEILTLLAEKS